MFLTNGEAKLHINSTVLTKHLIQNGSTEMMDDLRQQSFTDLWEIALQRLLLTAIVAIAATSVNCYCSHCADNACINWQHWNDSWSHRSKFHMFKRNSFVATSVICYCSLFADSACINWQHWNDSWSHRPKFHMFKRNSFKATSVICYCSLLADSACIKWQMISQTKVSHEMYRL